MKNSVEELNWVCIVEVEMISADRFAKWNNSDNLEQTQWCQVLVSRNYFSELILKTETASPKEK